MSSNARIVRPAGAVARVYRIPHTSVGPAPRSRAALRGAPRYPPAFATSSHRIKRSPAAQQGSAHRPLDIERRFRRLKELPHGHPNGVPQPELSSPALPSRTCRIPPHRCIEPARPKLHKAPAGASENPKTERFSRARASEQSALSGSRRVDPGDPPGRRKAPSDPGSFDIEAPRLQPSTPAASVGICVRPSGLSSAELHPLKPYI